MNTEITYEDAKRAFAAFASFSSDSKFSQKIPLQSALRIRRTLNVLRPYVIDLEDLSDKVTRESGWDRQGQPPSDLNDTLRALLETKIAVGLEPFSPTDLGLGATVPSTIVGILYEMGPFFVDVLPERGESEDEDSGE